MNGERPTLTVVVDTEEEFDWTADFRRENTSVSAIEHIRRFQTLCDEFGLRPCYAIDYPIATQRQGIEALGPLADAGRAEIGAHLHPWVTPPFVEELNRKNSFPGNLDKAVEDAKIGHLKDAIKKNFGLTPISYKAGRYGCGPNTPIVLENHGFLVDLSPAPPLSFTAEGGPDFSRYGIEPRWVRASNILILPSTGAYVGWMPAAHRIYILAATMSILRVPGLLARIGAVDRLRLSPEGYTPRENRKLTEAVLQSGIRNFVFSLHSPSFKLGCSPYVRTQADLETFVGSCREYFRYFVHDLGGCCLTPAEVRETLLGQKEASVIA
jgi:hypothetical protein